jgi:ubiquinone/menaquinone biosynthesis C-methylase UbiE
MDWHTRYLQQALWTAQLRAYLFQKARLPAANHVLDLGCGTGALLDGLPVKSGTAVFGLDLSLPSVQQAFIHAPSASLACADGAFLPYADSVFDLVFCHFVLLWTSDPLKVLAEMQRVTRPGGGVLALAEPDYGGRVDYPLELAELGRWQAESLRQQGADPEMGRKLAGIFARAGLKHVETGVMGGEWTYPVLPGETNLEWEVLESDLAGRIPLQDVRKMRHLETAARHNGERVLFVPTFYAWGTV